MSNMHFIAGGGGKGPGNTPLRGAMVPPPYRIKSVEPIRLLSFKERQEHIRAAQLNVFALPAHSVYVDLLTDSGTGAMSHNQWAAIMRGDESYAGSRSFERLRQSVQDLWGHGVVLPAHQGRGAEHVLFSCVLSGGGKFFVPNNTHFDTTRANVEQLGGTAVDLPCKQSTDLRSEYPFKGNMDCEALENLLKRYGSQGVPVVMMTLTNNSCGGHPASLENLRQVRRIVDSYGAMLFLDACRVSENAFFIKKYEPGFAQVGVREILRQILSLADGCTMSAKKDAIVNVGGFISLKTNKNPLYEALCEKLILYEGFKTYGGLAGRDLEAIAVGLQEGADEAYLEHRIEQVALLARLLEAADIKTVRPTGGHAVYVDAAHFLPHLKPEEFPGQALAVALYVEGGVRAVEVGSLMFDKSAAHEMLRLAVPRRVYTNEHILYVAECFKRLYKKRSSIRGVRLVKEPKCLRHFTAQMEWVAAERHKSQLSRL